MNLFLASLSTYELSWRSGLSVLAVMQTYPEHKFYRDPKHDNDPLIDLNNIDEYRYYCSTCGSPKRTLTNLSSTEFIFEAFNVGFRVTHNLDKFYVYMQLMEQQPEVKPKADDYEIFKSILDILLSTEPELTLKKEVCTRVKKIPKFKTTKEYTTYLLEILGLCSILETPKHKGLLNEYTSLAKAPRKSHHSDWLYPVDFWLGKDGINREALKFWFGEHDELKDYFSE